MFKYGITEAKYFEKVYGNNLTTKGILFALTPDHGIVILGDAVDSVSHRSGYYLLKTDSNGLTVWEKEIIDRHDAYSYSITTLKDGKIVVLGTHTEDSYPIVAEILILDSAGNYFNSSIYPPFNGWGTAGVGLTNSGDSSVTLTLYNDGFISYNYYSVFSLNPDLTTKWSDFVSFDGSFTNAHDISSVPGGNIYTLSYYDNYFYSINLLTRVTSIRRHNDSGTLLLDSIYEFNCVTTSITETNDGGAIILGLQDTSYQRDMVLIRLDSVGNVQWQKQFGSNLDEETNSVIETFDNGFAILSTIADPVIPGQHDLLLTKTNANGDSLWSRVFGGTLDEKALHLEEDNTDLVILGSTTSFNNNLIYLIKTDSAGIIQSPFNITTNGRYYCENDTASLLLNPPPSAGLHLTWSNGDTTNPARVYTSGNYFAVISDSSGNNIETPFTPVYFSLIPDASFGSDTMRICSGSLLTNPSAELTNSYQWYLNGQILQDENLSYIKPQHTGFYQLIIKNYCAIDTGITFIDSLYDNPIEPVITSPAVNFVCEGDSLPLSFTYNAGESYQWYSTNYIITNIITGETDSVYYALENGSYLVKATNANGCSVESSPKSVSFDLDKEFINVNGPLGFCKGGEVELSVQLGTEFLWSRGDTTQSITVDIAGEYFVNFINKNNCQKNSDTINITIFPNPKIYLGPDTVLCDSSTLLLTAGPGYSNYYWNDASTEPSLLARSNGIAPDTTDYFVFVTDSNGCTGGDSLRIIFDICTGINEVKNESLFIYPNPVSSNEPFQIISRENGFYTFILRDVLNKEIVKSQFKSILRLNESGDLKPGIYFYRIYNDHKINASGKLVVN